MRKSKKLNAAKQSYAIFSRFPQFNYYRGKYGPIWKGYLQPTNKSPIYTIKIEHRPYSYPSVWVLSPKIDPNAPHRYSDKTLCLYYPKDQSWTSTMFIAETIIPWTAEWLAYYEIWLISGKWYGPEAPHENSKSKY